MITRIFIAVMIVLCSTIAVAQDFYIEENGLRPVPSTADAAIRKAESDIAECRFEGKTIDLDGDGNATDLVVTTQDACAWGAALGPIWVLRAEKGSFTLVLSYGGYSLTLGKTKSNGLRDIAVMTATAARTETSIWRYDGRKYIEAKK